ncbi:MAG TPA: AraC family transcriptional regulator, partial [Segetibacter sp.]
MIKTLDILRVGQPETIESLDLLFQKEQNIPDSIQYTIKRYYSQQPLPREDTGMMVYHYNSASADKNYLELRYCISGNKYCEEKSCSGCHELPTNNCKGKMQTV